MGITKVNETTISDKSYYPVTATVTLVDGISIPISDITIGMRVVTYRTADVAFAMKGTPITDMETSVYSGDAIKILAGEHSSVCTADTILLVNFKTLKDKYAVYLMRRGNQFRIGKCKMDYSHSSGISNRMHSEGADCAWILKVYDDENAAYFDEQAISGKFGIPQLMFSPKKMLRGPSFEYLPRAWDYIGDNSHRGYKCLKAFGRLPNHPLISRHTSKQQTIKRPMYTAASNLMNDVLILPFIGRSHTSMKEWLPISITTSSYCGKVVSLTSKGKLPLIINSIVSQ